MSNVKIIIVLFSCFIIVCGLPYFVWLLYYIGENIVCLPTYLSMNEMLSYLTTALGALASTFIGVVAISQSRKIDVMSKVPNIAISEIANDPFYRLTENNVSSLDYNIHHIYKVGKIDCKMRFYLLFHILDRSLTKVIISPIIIYQINNNIKQKVATLYEQEIPDTSITSESFIPADSKFLFCCSTDSIEQGKSYLAEFITECETVEGYWFKKKWSMTYTYSNFDCITAQTIKGGFWENFRK